MPHPTDADHATARDIVESLFDREQNWYALPIETRLERLPKAVSIQDLEQDALQFRMEADFLRSLGSDFPGLTIDGASIPFSLPLLVLPVADAATGTTPPADRLLSLFERYLVLMEPQLDRLGELYGSHGFVPLSPDQAERTFSERAAASLALRIANAKGTDHDVGLLAGALKLPATSGATAASVPGCRFTVNTNTPGLQVFWSGAHSITQHYFGGPTTPVVGTLQSGTYMFGVSGGPYTGIQWDQAAICSLPGLSSVHLNY